MFFLKANTFKQKQTNHKNIKILGRFKAYSFRVKIQNTSPSKETGLHTVPIPFKANRHLSHDAK